MHWLTKLANNIVGIERTKELIAFSNSLSYSWIRTRNLIKKTVLGQKDNKYLFILSPPFCGSTLLNHIISSSTNVSSNNVFHSREGQQLPKVKEVLFKNNKRWNPDTTFDWHFIKSEWEKYWDVTKPILLEKSPCSIVRADVLEHEFEPAFFVILYRNPYAHCEGIMRRNNWGPVKAAQFALKCLRFQRKNMNQLKNAISFSYEEMSEHPDQIISKLQQHLPELQDLKISNNYPTQNVRNEQLKITNLNAEKISNLTVTQLEKINELFKKNIGLLKFFNYEIIEG